jgi:RNA-binding protein YhbY
MINEITITDYIEVEMRGEERKKKKQLYQTMSFACKINSVSNIGYHLLLCSIKINNNKKIKNKVAIRIPKLLKERTRKERIKERI